jgi:hypothetical protein
VTGPTKVLIRQEKLPNNAPRADTVMAIARLYDQAGQVCDVNTSTPHGSSWDRTVFLATTASGRSFYGRPSLDVRNDKQQIVLRSGIIIDADRAQRPCTDDRELMVDLPGREMGALTVGAALPGIDSADPIVRILTVSPEDLRLGSEGEVYPFDPSFERLEAGNTLRAIATASLRAFAKDEP